MRDLIAAALACTLLTQDPAPAVPSMPLQDGAIEAVVATVNGEAILASEVEDALDSVSALFDRSEIVRQLVYQRLLDQKAKAAGLTIDDEKLTRVMRERVTQAGGWDAYRAKLDERGDTPDRDRHEIVGALLADEYVDHCVGLVPGSPHLRPDLARLLQVTPKEVQDFYREHKDRFRTVDRRVFGRVQIVKDPAGSVDAQRTLMLKLRQTAIVDHHGSLKDAAAALGAGSYAEQELVEGRSSGLRPEIVDFLATSPTFVPSPVLETGKAFLCVVKVEETLGRQREFNEVQEGIQQAILVARRNQARWTLGAELLKSADIWPDGLIPTIAPPPASAPAAPPK